MEDSDEENFQVDPLLMVFLCSCSPRMFKLITSQSSQYYQVMSLSCVLLGIDTLKSCHSHISKSYIVQQAEPAEPSHTQHRRNSTFKELPFGRLCYAVSCLLSCKQLIPLINFPRKDRASESLSASTIVLHSSCKWHLLPIAQALIWFRCNA